MQLESDISHIKPMTTALNVTQLKTFLLEAVQWNYLKKNSKPVIMSSLHRFCLAFSLAPAI